MGRTIAAAILVISPLVGFAVHAQPTISRTTPGEIKYEPIQFAPGAEFVYLASDGSKPENYSLRVHLRPDAKIPPHTHPDTRMIVVLSGELFVGSGVKIDPNSGSLLPAGSFFTVPAGMIHWSWAKNGETTYQEFGTGPTATNLTER
jgi:quercetin dioxygenase-like cupin family protein